MQRNPTDPSTSATAWQAWHQIFPRNQEERDVLTPRELKPLRFLFWLTQTGRLVADGRPAAIATEAPCP